MHIKCLGTDLLHSLPTRVKQYQSSVCWVTHADAFSFFLLIILIKWFILETPMGVQETTPTPPPPPTTTTTSKASSNQLTYWDNVSCEETCICGTEQQHCSREGWWSTETGNASEDGLHESGGRTGWKTRTPKTKWKTRTQEQDGKQELQEQNGKQELKNKMENKNSNKKLYNKVIPNIFLYKGNPTVLYCTVLYASSLSSFCICMCMVVVVGVNIVTTAHTPRTRKRTRTTIFYQIELCCG